MRIEQHTDSPEAMEALGARLASQLPPGIVLHLHGTLGAGKTTLVRGILHGLGYRGTVKSPTYTLVEPYSIDGKAVYHFDLYRLKDPEELEFLGIRDYLEGQGICLIEWAGRGESLLPPPDVDVHIERDTEGRAVRLTARTVNGERMLGGFR
ncbi:MAG: tRNA (adenosine(37)-N6)-threonylcarbamoyltransferase complex ATPase subunit type 1 TsaE [Gammaproteobacteria bacterium]|nr:tRNA (adenosine(37)-N6)-threonylcarbamoyltransferase complex ATPase subunit type 1 TsaE [Gammaproteobacteria bacterium]